MNPAVELRPVLELAPSDFATRERRMPQGPVATMPEQWDAWWRDSMADAGLVGLEPVAVGSWFVALDTLSVDERLGRVLDVLMGDIEFDDHQLVDTIGPLAGGFVLRAGDRAIYPGCCGDLGNLRDWRDAADHDLEDWRKVWIGHPWTHVRAVDGRLQLAAPSEREEPLEHDPPLSVPRQALRDAVREAQLQVDAFRRHLRQVLETRHPGCAADAIARVLVEGHGWDAGA